MDKGVLASYVFRLVTAYDVASNTLQALDNGEGRPGSWRKKDGGKDPKMTAGLIAAVAGDIAGMAAAAADGWNPATSCDSFGSGALMWAAGGGHLAACDWLVLQRGVPIGGVWHVLLATSLDALSLKKRGLKNASNDLQGNMQFGARRYCSPRQWMPFNSIHEGVHALTDLVDNGPGRCCSPRHSVLLTS
jgi:hypothetical protein